jgi:hypothetical protein
LPKRREERPHRLANASGFALMKDGTIQEMSANEFGKLPPRREKPWIAWHMDRRPVEILAAKMGATAPVPHARTKKAEVR